MDTYLPPDAASEIEADTLTDLEIVAIEQLAAQELPLEERSQAIEVIVAGHICLDIIPRLRGDAIAFTPGRLIEAGKTILATGGPISNTGLALHKLGINTRLMGKVGDDLFGQAIFQLIEARGPELIGGMIVAVSEASSYSLILSSPHVDRVIIHAPGCNNTFGADDVRYDLLEQARLFHFGYPPLMERMYRNDGAELAEMLRRARACGVTTSLDLSLPDPASAAGRVDWSAILRAALPHVDVFLPSIEELLFMLQRPLFEQLVAEAGAEDLIEHVAPPVVQKLGRQLLKMGVKIVGIKMGQRGMYLCTGNDDVLIEMGRAQPANPAVWALRELWSPCFQTHVAGTTGSGDATIAGFLLGLLRGMSPESSLAAACAVGACSVEAVDAVSGVRTWPDTYKRIARRWVHAYSKYAQRMRVAGGFWDTYEEIWYGPDDVQWESYEP